MADNVSEIQPIEVVAWENEMVSITFEGHAARSTFDRYQWSVYTVQIERGVICANSGLMKFHFGPQARPKIWSRTFRENPYYFEIYICWLTTRNLLPGTVETNHWRGGNATEDRGYYKLMMLYEFACWLQDGVFQDVVMGTFFDKLQSLPRIDLPGPNCIARLYWSDKGEPLRKLKQLIVDAYVAEESREDIQKVAGFRTGFRYPDGRSPDLSEFRLELDLARLEVRRQNRTKLVNFSRQDYYVLATEPEDQ